MAHLKEFKNAWGRGLQDAQAELDLLTVEEDDLGQTHVRYGQVYRGVPVFGGQLIVQLNAASVRDVFGQAWKDARGVDTRPKITPAQAIAAAKAALGYTGAFANQPEATLFVLPHPMKDPKAKSGATLVYHVELLIEDGTDATARHFYFVNADDGSIVWHYDALMRDGTPSVGTGNSQYNGVVSIPTAYKNGAYYLQDANDPNDPNNRGGMYTQDMQNQCDDPNTCYNFSTTAQTPAVDFTDSNNVWGDGNIFLRDPISGLGTGSMDNRQTAAVDAHFGAAKTWDYYLSKFQRRGIDGAGYPLQVRVHIGRNFFNAFYNARSVAFGDGNASNGNKPFVSLDIVAHEIAHGVTQKTLYPNVTGANDYYVPGTEAAAFNESFSDIFGTSVEYYVYGVRYDANNTRKDYLIGEDVFSGRSLVNPPSVNQGIDHYSNIANAAGNQHRMAGIQNKAFYLLAEGGTHGGVQVTGIGRDAAEQIFYRALTMKLTASDRYFSNVRYATLRAATDIYGTGSAQYNSTVRAWDAVGVLPNAIDNTRVFVRQQYLDFFNRELDQAGWDAWTNYINNCGPQNAQCPSTDYGRIETVRGFMESLEFRQRVGGAFNPPSPGPGDTPYNREYVRQCYLVFLRRSPVGGEEQGWLNYLFGTADYHGTIGGFINSTEYRARFGQV